MEPIAELEDDEEGFDYDNSAGINSMNDSRNMMHFRSRSNTWPQFSNLAYDDAGAEQADDDTHELTDKADPLCQPPYSLYESPYHKALHGLESEGPLYSNHLHPGGPGEFSGPGPHSELTSTSSPTNLSLHKGTSAYYQSASSGSSLTRASNHFSSRNDDLETGSPPEPSGINGAHPHLHVSESGPNTTGSSSTVSVPGTGSGASLGSASASAVASALKKNTSRRNAWGNMSYADLITQAINGSPEKRLTLSQIYEWMVQNVTYFKDKGDSNSSAGWKNSIRHNLSLHNRFMRVQNEGTGKSSWWMINPDAKPGKAARRRAISMETHNYEKRRGRVKRRVEQLRAAGLCGGHDPSILAPLSEYPHKSSEPSLLLSSSSGNSSFKLAGSTSSLLSPQTSLSNLCLGETGSGTSNPHLVTSPSSADSYDPFSESSVNLNHFHSSASNYSPGEFRPRASSNASSTCSTVNLLIDNDNHQVPSISPHNWTTDLRLYNSAGNSFSSNLEQTSTGPGYRNSANELQLIDCLANLATGSAHNYRMMVEEEDLMHNKNNGQTVHSTPSGGPDPSGAPSAHSEMMLLGSDLPGHGTTSHSYNDLYKLQPQSQQTGSVSPSTSSPPTNSSAKVCFTSLDSVPERKTSGSFFKSPSSSLIETSQVGSAGGKVHEINNNSASGSANSLYEVSYQRYSDQQRSSSLANLAAYQHSAAHHPGKMSLPFMYSQDPAQCFGYGGNEASFGYYDYATMPHEALTHYASHATGDLDLDFDTVCAQSGMLECDVDQVIRHELSVDGSLDFGLTSAGTNADSTTSSTSTTPTTSHSQNTYPMHSTEASSQAPPKASQSPSGTEMEISYEAHHSPFYTQATESVTQTYATLTSVSSASGVASKPSASSSSDNPLPTQSPLPLASHSSLSSVVPLRPSSVIYGPYSPSHYLASSHYLSSVANTTSAAVVAAAAAETAVSVSVTSPVTVSGHHQQPVTSRSWVH